MLAWPSSSLHLCVSASALSESNDLNTARELQNKCIYVTLRNDVGAHVEWEGRLVSYRHILQKI